MDTAHFTALCAALWIVLSVAGYAKVRADRNRECDEMLPGTIDSLEHEVGTSLGHRRP